MTCVIFHKVIYVLSSGRNPLRSSPLVLRIGLYPGRETKDDITLSFVSSSAQARDERRVTMGESPVTRHRLPVTPFWSPAYATLSEGVA